MFYIEDKPAPKQTKKTVSIIPAKDHVIKHNEFYYELKAGIEIEIDQRFVESLKQEKVLNN